MSTTKELSQQILNEKTLKIIPENIKKDVQIFDVVGSLESGGSGDVKLFDTVEHMQEDPDAQDGDLAIVYASSQANFDETTQTQFITFPETVVLPEAFSGRSNITLTAVDSSIRTSGSGDLRAQRFSLLVYLRDIGENYRIEYTSSDGINYTRTRFQKNGGTELENPVDFGAFVEWGESEWNDLIGYFMIVGNTEFEGLFKYSLEDNRYDYAKTGFSAKEETVYKGRFYGQNGIKEGALSNIENLTISELKNRVNVYDHLSSLSLSENLTNLYNTFANSKIYSIPKINTSNIENFGNMFYMCNNLVNVPEMNMSNASYYAGMFTGCNNLSNFSLVNIANSLPAGNQVNNLVYNTGLLPNRFDNNTLDMLWNKGYIDCDQNTTGWATQYNIYNGNSYTLVDKNDFDRYARNLKNAIPNIINNGTNVNLTIRSDNGVDNGILFSTSGLFSYKDNVYSANMYVNTSNLRDASHMFSYCYNLRNIANFDTTNVTNMAIMFRSCFNLTTIPNFNTSNVTSMIQFLCQCQSLTSLPNFNTSNVVNMSSAFFGCSKLTSIPNFNLSKVEDVNDMLGQCFNLTSVPNFDTSNVKNMTYMVSCCENITTVPNFNTSNVTNMFYMFNKCFNLTTVPNFDTSNVVSMCGMFCNCNKLSTIPEFNTNNVENMSSMFQDCNKIINAVFLNTEKVTAMNYMFSGCFNLINVPEYNTTNVKGIRSMFAGCTNLTTIPNFNTSNVTSMGAMFYNCWNLTTIPNFNTSNVTSISEMFYNCQNITTVPNFDLSKVTSLTVMFFNCKKLVNVPQFNISNVTEMLRTFAECNNLSDNSIQNIINMCLNSNITTDVYKTLLTNSTGSPFYNTNITNTRYQNRWEELTAAGWTY